MQAVDSNLFYIIKLIIETFFSSVFGFVFGNFVTTLFFRIPRKIPVIGYALVGGMKPHCSLCKHDLRFYEYLPPFHWFTVFGKCNYCNKPIDKIYNKIEFAFLIYSILLQMFLGFSNEYIINMVSAIPVFFIFSVYARFKRIYIVSIFALLFMGTANTIYYLL